MASPIPSYTKAYRTLREAAQTFGFHREAGLIARREESLGQPFTLFVVGEEGAGKSALINLLTGRALAPIGRATPWINIYRRPEGGHELAEVMLEDDPVPTILTIEEARAFTDDVGPEARVAGGKIDRIVWHVNAPGLPLDVAFAEAPSIEGHDLPERYYWQADGLLWLVRADRLVDQKARMLVRSMPQRRVLPVVTMGILTHMDVIPNNRWLQVVQDARSDFAGALDLVVPSTTAFDRVDTIFDDPNGLLYRELRNRFFQGARMIRMKNQAHFIAAMGHALAGRFEGFVDRVLANRWAYFDFQRQLDERLVALQLLLAERVEAYAGALRVYAEEYAAALEKPDYAPPETIAERAWPPPSLDGLRTGIHAAVVEASQQIFAQLHYDERPVTQWKTHGDSPVPHREGRALSDPPAASFRLPELPIGHLSFLRDTTPTARITTEARIYEPGTMGDGATHPAELWQSAQVWMPRIAERAAVELTEWQTDVLRQVRRSLLDGAALSFKALHGFLPGETGAILTPLEETYEQLRGRSHRVPTPHLPGDGVSPALFLCRLQEASFIANWNRELTQKCFDAVMPRLHKQILHDIDRLREDLIEQWDQSRESVDRRVEVAWRDYGRGLALKNAVKWSVPWISSLIRDRLVDPIEHLARRRVSFHPPYDLPVALFLDAEGTSFLEPIYKPVDPPLNPDQFLAERVLEEVRQNGRSIWRVKAPITIGLGLRSTLRRRTSLAVGTLACFALLWIMLFGTSTVSLTSLCLIAAPYIGLVGYAINRMIGRTFATGHEAQAEHVFSLIRTHISDRMNELRRELDERFCDVRFREEIERALSECAATPSSGYLPYAELIRRLERMNEVKVQPPA